MKKIYMFLAIPFLVWGCTGSSETESINQLLTNRSSKVWINYSQTNNGVEQLNECQKDDEWTFFMNGNININPGIIRCTINEKDSQTSFLLAGPNNDSFYYTNAGERNSGAIQTTKGHILELTQTKFRFRITIISADGNSAFTSEYSFRTPDNI